MHEICEQSGVFFTKLKGLSPGELKYIIKMGAIQDLPANQQWKSGPLRVKLNMIICASLSCVG